MDALSQRTVCSPPYYLESGLTPQDVLSNQVVYVVFVGREPGIHSSLARATAAITSFPGGSWRKGAMDLVLAQWQNHCLLNHHHGHTAPAPPHSGPPPLPTACAPSQPATPAPRTPTTPAPHAAYHRSSTPSVQEPIASPATRSSYLSSESSFDTPSTNAPEVEELANQFARTATLHQLHREYFFIAGHVFHTRSSADIRVAELFPNPRRRPHIRSHQHMSHVLVGAFKLLHGGHGFSFEMTVWDADRVCVTTMDLANARAAGQALNTLSLEYSSDLVVIMDETPVVGPSS